MASPDGTAAREPLRLSLIAAVAENGVIGQDGAMPWKLSTDLRRFKSITMGKPVIMGRKTFDSCPRPLHQSVQIVLTRGRSVSNSVVAVRSVEAATSAAHAAAAASDVVEAVVIGGGEVFALFMPMATRLYITHVADSPVGETLFPGIDQSQWRQTDFDSDGGGREVLSTRFAVYERL